MAYLCVSELLFYVVKVDPTIKALERTIDQLWSYFRSSSNSSFDARKLSKFACVEFSNSKEGQPNGSWS